MNVLIFSTPQEPPRVFMERLKIFMSMKSMVLLSANMNKSKISSFQEKEPNSNYVDGFPGRSNSASLLRDHFG